MRFAAPWKWIAPALKGALRVLAREVGPRELAILLFSLGVYLAVGAIWPEGATGSALIAAGWLALWVTVPRRKSPVWEDSRS